MNDLGIEAVELIYEMFKVDEQWSVKEKRGFRWWGHKLCQKIYASEGFNDNGVFIFRIYCETDLIKNVSAPPPVVEEIISNLVSLTTGSSIIYNQMDKSIKMKSIGVVHDNTFSWMNRVINSIFILQVIEAEELCKLLVDKVGGEIDYSEHPISGERQIKDEMLSVKDLIFLPEGEKPSTWGSSQELVSIKDMLNSNNFFSMGDSRGLTAEFTFGDDTSMMQVITNERNPLVGNGVKVILHLPIHDKVEQNQSLSNKLNQIEASGHSPSHFIGSWGVKKYSETNSCPVFSMFLPNPLHQNGILTNFIYTFMARAAWAAELIKPGENERDTLSIINERLQRLNLL